MQVSICLRVFECEIRGSRQSSFVFIGVCLYGHVLVCTVPTRVFIIQIISKQTQYTKACKFILAEWSVCQTPSTLTRLENCFLKAHYASKNFFHRKKIMLRQVVVNTFSAARRSEEKNFDSEKTIAPNKLNGRSLSCRCPPSVVYPCLLLFSVF